MPVNRGTTEGPAPSRARAALRDFAVGAGLVGRGFRLWSTSPRLMLLGVIPALIVGLVYTAGIVLLAINLGTLATWVTPFAGEWDEPIRSITRGAAALGIAGLSVLIVIATFTAVTLAIGDPFYEKIWRAVEDRLGGIQGEVDVPFWRSIRRGVADAVRILAFAVIVGITLFLGGFIPVVGQTVVPVLGAVAGGWILALELTGLAFEARGFSATQRRAILRRKRAMALGFGMATYLLFLIPLGAVLVMPAAVAGAAMLGRHAIEAAASSDAGGGAPR